MSQSIFHVRPLDAGKGWAIDEYDGRGAWQRTIPIGPDGAPMDKQLLAEFCTNVALEERNA